MNMLFSRPDDLIRSISDETGNEVAGSFVDHENERFYVIRNIDRMPPFLISVVSHSDHWLFVSSNGGMTAGRVSPELALFPYVAADKVQDSVTHTGSKTLLRVFHGHSMAVWEPFNREHDGLYSVQRSLYKNTLGNKLCFEETNDDLQLTFRYTWMVSDRYGFVRQCELLNLSGKPVQVQMLDGVQNLMPAGLPRQVQTSASNLVDAYKWTELDSSSGVACYSLYSCITDKPEPCESLYANTVFSLGLEQSVILLSNRQLDHFRQGRPLQQEEHTRGIRGAYFVNSTLRLPAHEGKRWQLVANVQQSQAQVVNLCHALSDRESMARALADSVRRGSDELQRIMAGMDAFQTTAEENVSVHHYANVLFNGMRGGVFDDQYRIDTADFSATVRHFNQEAYHAHAPLLSSLPPRLAFHELFALIQATGDAQLERLCHEYLPLTFGRRHGDPSRPWNEFAIRLRNEEGKRLLSYQGNWRDIFQNWEALLFSYPEFVENSIARFVNASTIDGYNPYRITKEGIDWEIEDPEDPWSYIGYWGDHQIIYLLKLLELSRNLHPGRLASLLRHQVFCYANVPYRIKPFSDLLKNPKDTVVYDGALEQRIGQRVAAIGADGKLLLDENDKVYLVNLAEKLLVPLLSKLGNLIPGGGIWLNTQRPEWNDANNALVGQGLSMVTLYYLRRYVLFLQDLFHANSAAFQLSAEVSIWLADTAAIVGEAALLPAESLNTPRQCLLMLEKLGMAASRYRETVYRQGCFNGVVFQETEAVMQLLSDSLHLIDDSIRSNRRQDGLYHAYNLLEIHADRLDVDHLYPMLEGQVAVLSSGAIDPASAVDMLESLFASAIYRADQQTFMLYPDRQLPGFLAKNRIEAAQVQGLPALQQLLDDGDETLLLRDADGVYRFNANLINRAALDARLDKLADRYADIGELRAPLHTIYEQVFRHKEFTGRSGGMFGFEGLGCIYWHMVSKLLLATQEMFFTALEQQAEVSVASRLGQLYYRVREGIGFNKSPAEYGAFPTDPYSHTPKHAGAQQPGMTGQVKEEILTRFGELGLRIGDGKVSFQPGLLRAREFIGQARHFRYLDVSGRWQELLVPAQGLAFTWCQVPIVYLLDDDVMSYVKVQWSDSHTYLTNSLELSAEISSEIVRRTGNIHQLTVVLNRQQIYWGNAQIT
ncbi:MAG: hypothetical protein JG718_17470 [Candidatus Thiothrix moscowensis]|nr:hypothetical protein [Candidatus Thiothrix moscowensis]